MEQICPTVNGISAVSELNEGGEGWRKRGEGRGVRLGETDKHIKTASLPATHLLFTLLQLNCVSLNTHSPSAPVHTAIHLHALLHRFTQTLSNKQTKVHTHSCVCMYAHTHTTHVHAHTHTNTKKYPQHTWIQAEKKLFFLSPCQVQMDFSAKANTVLSREGTSLSTLSTVYADKATITPLRASLSFTHLHFHSFLTRCY